MQFKNFTETWKAIFIECSEFSDELRATQSVWEKIFHLQKAENFIFSQLSSLVSDILVNCSQSLTNKGSTFPIIQQNVKTTMLKIRLVEFE